MVCFYAQKNKEWFLDGHFSCLKNIHCKSAWRNFYIRDTIHPWIILLEKRRDLTITLWERAICYTVTHRQLNSTLSLIRSRCKHEVGLGDRIAPGSTIHGKDPIGLVLVEAWYGNTSLVPILYQSQYQVYTYVIPGKNQSSN